MQFYLESLDGCDILELICRTLSKSNGGTHYEENNHCSYCSLRNLFVSQCRNRGTGRDPGPMKKCPRIYCGYKRKPTDDEWAPLTECPKCGVIYARAELAWDIAGLIDECLEEISRSPYEDLPDLNETDEEKVQTEVGSIFVSVIHRHLPSSHRGSHTPILTEFHKALKEFFGLGHLIKGADYYTLLWNESEEMYETLKGTGFNPVERMCLKATERSSQQSTTLMVKIGALYGEFMERLEPLLAIYSEELTMR